MKLFEHDAPLGMPKGSIRAMLALIFTLTYCIGGSLGVSVNGLEKPVYIIITVYFLGRTVAEQLIQKIMGKK